MVEICGLAAPMPSTGGQSCHEPPAQSGLDQIIVRGQKPTNFRSFGWAAGRTPSAERARACQV